MSLGQEKALEECYLMPTFARKQVEFVSGVGMKVFDDSGKEYLDFIAGIGVVSLGHCHPALTQALQEQAARLMHVGNYYYIEKRGEVARSISDLLHEASVQDGAPEVWQSFFTNSGAEANECAIKLARLASKKQGRDARYIVTLEKSFHGRTLATLAATAQPAKQAEFKPLPDGFLHTPINDCEALKRLFAEKGNTICAVMVECVQGESGVHPCSQEFLATAQSLAHQHGALLICDEIQTGVYRCGTYPFAFQHHGISPDIVTIAKGVGGGFPTGVCAAKTSVAQAFEPGDHGTTYGGSSLAIAAICATLHTHAQLDTAKKVEETGAYLQQCLDALPHVVQARGLGLMRGCDLDKNFSAPEIVDKALEEGLIINATGPQTLRFLPPLICTKAHIDSMIERLEKLLS